MRKLTKIGALTGVLIFLALIVFGPAMAKKHKSNDSWIGVYIQTIDEDLQEAFDLDQDRGVVITDVVDNSPADDAGLRRKDIIVEFNGEAVEDIDDLSDMIDDVDAGEEVEAVIIRKGKKKTVEIEVEKGTRYEWLGKGSRSYGNLPKIIKRGYSFSSGGRGYIGVSIQNLSEQLGEYFGVEDGEGVLITEVFEDSPAEEAGIKAGDVVVSVDGEEVYDTGDLKELIAEKEEDDEVIIGYLRKGSKEELTVKVTEESYGFSNFSIPDIDIRIPDLSGLRNLDHFYFSDDLDDIYHDFHDSYFDQEEYKKEMKELQRELKEMGKELREIKKKLD